MDRLLQALAEAGDGVFVVNSARQIIYWNPAAERLTGLTREDVRGRHCYQLMGGSDEEGRRACQSQCSVAAARMNGRPAGSFDTTVRTSTGPPCWVNMSSFDYPTSDEGDVVVLHLFRDISESKQAERFLKELRERLEQFTTDTPGKTPPMVEPNGEPTDDSLTPREREVLELLAHGRSTQDIAQDLVISPATVRNHIRQILSKLNVHSRLEAVTYAFKYDLVNLGQD